MKLTVDILKEVAKELNESVQPDPPIKINTKSTIQGLTDEIKETAQILEDGDILTQKTVDVLLDMEVDVPAKIKIQGGKKNGKKGTKKTQSKKTTKADTDAYGFKIGSKNNLFIETVKKNPMTMGEIKKQKWNTTETTYYTLLNQLIEKKIARVDKENKIHIIK